MIERTVPSFDGGGDDCDGAAAELAAFIPGAVSVVAGRADHNMASSDPEFQAALVSFVRQQWSSE